MRVAKAIPAAEWLAAKTDEDRDALRDKYTVELAGEELAAFEAQREKDTKAARIQLLEEEKQEKQAALEASDKDMARAAEDVIEALFTKGLLTEDDLPQAVKDKLAHRKALREEIGK